MNWRREKSWQADNLYGGLEYVISTLRGLIRVKRKPVYVFFKKLGWVYIPEHLFPGK